MQVIEVSKKKFAPCTPQQKIEVEEKIKRMRKEGDKQIKGIFEFVDAQGGWIDFSLRIWPGEGVKTYKITHGEICEIPMTLVKHLNNVYKKVRMMPDNLDLGKGTITKISRTRFTPLDVM